MCFGSVGTVDSIIKESEYLCYSERDMVVKRNVSLLLQLNYSSLRLKMTVGKDEKILSGSIVWMLLSQSLLPAIHGS